MQNFNKKIKIRLEFSKNYTYIQNYTYICKDTHTEAYVYGKGYAGSKSHINDLCEIMRKIYLIKMFVRQINY